MTLNVRAQLTILVVVPLSVFLLLTATFAWHERDTEAASFVLRHTHDEIVAIQDVRTTLLEVETGMRGYVITGTPRFADPYRQAAAHLEPALARMRNASGASENAKRLLEKAAVRARSAFEIDEGIVKLVDRAEFAAARSAVADGAGQRAMDRFHEADARAIAPVVAEREIGLHKVTATWHRTYLWIAASVLIGLAMTIALYFTISRNISRRLLQVGEDALAISEGRAPGPVARGDDEITHLERSFRTLLVMAQRREASLVRYKLLSEQARDIMFWTDAHDCIIEANTAALRAYGYTHAEMLTLCSAALCAEPSSPAVCEKFASVGTNGAALFEIDNVRKDGEIFPVEVTINSTQIAEEPVSLFIVRDITERHRADAALTAAYENAVQSSHLKSQFVATMSHEIRTPMNAVIGMNELLLGTNLTDEQREFTETVRDSSLSLLRIIDDVLDFSKIEAGRLDLEIIEIDVSDIVESAAALLRQEAQRKGISLMTFVQPDIHPTMLGDSTRLRQVLVNLVGNAVKFTQKGGVVVEVTLQEESKESLVLLFTVSDTGAGFDAATAALIFEPFRQADGSTTRKFGGTGLGLSISRRLVELMGGVLTGTSTPGAGSQFRFTAHFSRSKDDTVSWLPSLAGSRVLIVDDEPTARDILKRYVVAWGMDAGVAADVPDALAMLQESAAANAPYDVAIVDHTVGALTGFDLATQVKENVTIAATKLIMVSAYDGSQWGEASIAAGFSCFLTKPVRHSLLYDCLAKAVRTTQRAAIGKRPKEERPAAPGGGESRPERILIAEDNPVNRRLALQQLKKLGFVAEAVANGEEAVHAVCRERYDVILMDCQMPVMDGYAATRAIRENEARTGQHVPIVAMTANARREDREECLATGMDDYLAKPVLMENLRDILKTWLPPSAVA